jgi:teichuronic acid biosynthesis glycosyltransferase TuaC
MRILTFTSLFPNSVQPWHGSFVYQRVAHLARRPGNSVTVVAPVPYAPFWISTQRWREASSIPAREKFEELDVYHPRYFLLPKISMPLHGLSMFAGSLRTVRQLHEKIRFDCIDAHYIYPDGFAAVRLGKSLGIPVIVSARGTDISLFPSFRLIRPMIQWTLRNATGVVGVCEALKQSMLGLGASVENTRAIGNGVDVQRFMPMERREARAKLDIPLDAEVVVAVGNLVPVKGHQFLIPAIARLTTQCPKIILYIVGEGYFRAKLEALAKQEKVQDRVVFVGRKPNEELRYWYSAADVSCLASSREGWANVLLESLACGTPVVATRVWGAPEVITSPDLGFLVDGSVGSIAAGLGLALHKRWNREALARYAASRTWDVVASEVENFLKLQIRPEGKRRPEAGEVQSDLEG